MKIVLLFLLIPFLGYTQVQIGNDIDGEAAFDYSGRSVSLSSDGSFIAIGADGNDGNGSYSGHVRIFENISGAWTQIGTDINGEAASDASGWCVSLSGNGEIVAIGAPSNAGNGTYSGQVRVYQNLSGVWTQIGLDINGEAAWDESGASIALSNDGTILVIGASGNDGNGTNSGHVRVYQNSSGNWFQVGLDINGEALGDTTSGISVALSNDGTIVAIGSSYNDGNNDQSGSVRIYQNISGTWTKIGQDLDGEAIQDFSGESISLSSDGQIVAIGAIGNNGNGSNSGHVRVYQNSSGVWTQIGLDIDGEAANDYSGSSVSLSGDGSIVAIGAITNDGNGSNAGHVRVYKNNAGVWIQIGVDIDGEAIDDFSGRSVSLSENGAILAIGAKDNDGNGTDSGQVRVYDLTSILSTDSFDEALFAIYPNPATDVLNISLNNHVRLEKVKIYNTLGQLLNTETSNVIHINNLATGTYFVEVITNQGKTTKKIIKK